VCVFYSILVINQTVESEKPSFAEHESNTINKLLNIIIDYSNYMIIVNDISKKSLQLKHIMNIRNKYFKLR
jgi:hypothetical protein